MQQQSIQLKISDTIGTVSGEVIIGNGNKAVLTLAHGAGAGMHHNFMIELATALSNLGITTLRFNFPYMEQQKKRPDVPAIAHKTVEAAIQKAHELFPGVPLFAAGKSFGGRMSSQYLSDHNIEIIKGIIFVGFPLHPAGKPSMERAEHLKKITQPMLFLQGTRDELATWSLIEHVVSDLPKATLAKFEGADHAFKAAKQKLIPVLAQAIADWIQNH